MKTVLRTLAAAAAVVFLASCNGGDDVTPASTQYRTAVDRVIAKYNLPGVIASVRVPGDEPWSSTFGVADLATRQPLDPGSFFPIRSITKSYTVTALLLLAIERQAENMQAVFADTGNEHDLTYEYVRYLAEATGVPIRWVRAASVPCAGR